MYAFPAVQFQLPSPPGGKYLDLAIPSMEYGQRWIVGSPRIITVREVRDFFDGYRTNKHDKLTFPTGKSIIRLQKIETKPDNARQQLPLRRQIKLKCNVRKTHRLIKVAVGLRALLHAADEWSHGAEPIDS